MISTMAKGHHLTIDSSISAAILGKCVLLDRHTVYRSEHTLLYNSECTGTTYHAFRFLFLGHFKPNLFLQNTKIKKKEIYFRNL